MKYFFPYLVFFFALGFHMYGQRMDALIEGFGETYSVDTPFLNLNSGEHLRLIFDIYQSPDENTRVNPSINTLARAWNMHILSGMDPERIHLIAVVHNQATKDILDDAAYRKRYGVENPNLLLIRELRNKGVVFYVCGQSLGARSVKREELAEGVEVALSAMTALSYFLNRQYVLIKF